MNYCEDLARNCQHYHGNIWNVIYGMALICGTWTQSKAKLAGNQKKSSNRSNDIITSTERKAI